ncbi:type II/IV secretion system protein [Candidatus Wolfebacteria bacterium]|nr:type II/IV secretion system protein [Candidatus Wolfebacteria bacterium]
MELTSSQLKILFLGSGLITSDQFDLIEKAAKEKNIPLEEYLPQSGFISDKHAGQVIANYLKVNFIDLSSEKISEEAIVLVPEAVARSQKSVVFKEDEKNIYVASSSPENYEFFKFLERKTGKSAIIYYALPSVIKESFRYYKSDLVEQMAGLINELIKSSQSLSDKEFSRRNEENIVKFVNLLLEYANYNRASDIHIEPLEKEVSVRLRIDGVLHEVIKYSKLVNDKIVFRLKIMARLRTDEHAAAQDGRFSYSIDEMKFDIRISVLPVVTGENIVMRLLAESSRRLFLEDLGLFENDFEKVKAAAAKPYGMILVAGPTGSGKTTTLYAILQILNDPEVNIMTIEDPVEYEMVHIQQTQVNQSKNLTFATGLRSIVRQDPDIVMVGEIRDGETAQIAVNAAMTGHLLLSTLHANDAATTFPRLNDMGIEPFLIASATNIVVAQRLVRKICERCKISYFLSEEEMNFIKKERVFSDLLKKISGKKDFSKIRFYKGKGCKNCGGSGYSGRSGIFEILEITDPIRSLIVNKSNSDVISEKARELGMTTMLQDGLTKALRGLTSLEEVIRETKI